MIAKANTRAMLAIVDTIPFSEKSSGVDMIIPMARSDISSPNKFLIILPFQPGQFHRFLCCHVFHQLNQPSHIRYFTSPENKLEICGELRPKSRFLGNSAATIMEGASYAMFLDRPEDGEYHITMPNM